MNEQYMQRGVYMYMERKKQGATASGLLFKDLVEARSDLSCTSSP